MELYSYNNTTIAYLIELNDDIALDLLPAMIWLGLFMVVGVIGNSFVVYVFLSKLHMCTQHIFIVWLAIFDLMSSAFSMPSEIQDLRYQILFDNRLSCRIMKFIDNYCACGSVFMLTAIAADRYRKVCQPLKPQITVKVAKMVLLAILVISIGFSIPAFLLFGLKSKEITPYVGVYGYACSIDDSVKDSVIPVIYSGNMFLVFSVSSITLTYVYIRIWFEAKRHNLRLVKKGNNSAYTSLASANVTISDRWFSLRDKVIKTRRQAKNTKKTTRKTPFFRPVTEKSEPSVSYFESESMSSDSPTDSSFERESPEQSLNKTAHLIQIDALFMEDSISHITVPRMYVSEREKSSRGILKKHWAKTPEQPNSVNALSTEKPIWSDVLDVVKKAGTDTDDEFAGGNYPPQNDTKISEPENVQALSRAVSDTILEVCSSISNKIHIDDTSFMPEDQTPAIDKNIHNAAGMSFVTSRDYLAEESATDSRTLSRERSSCQPRQTIGKQENFTRNALARDTVEDAENARCQACFCILPGEVSVSTEKMRVDPPLTTPSTNTNTNSESSIGASTESRNKSLMAVFGRTLSLSSIPVLRIVSGAQINSDDSTDNVVGHLHLTRSHTVLPQFGWDKVTKTAVMITVTFLFSFVPYMILMVLRLLEVITIEIGVRGARLCLYHIFVRSFFLNSVANPFIYAAHNLQFRKEFVKLVRRLEYIKRRIQTRNKTVGSSPKVTRF